MNHSTPGLPIHHQLPEFTQTHAHWVGDAIQPSHPLLSPSPAPNPSQHKKRKLHAKSLYDYRCKNTIKNTSKLNSAAYLKGLYTMSKWNLFQECGMIQNSKINQWDIAQTNISIESGEKPSDHIHKCRKAFDKMQHLFMNKNSQQTRNRRELCRHDEGYLWGKKDHR